MNLQILQGDCRDVLKTLPDESVNCVVTSPPYWGLRDYGTATWEGGDEGCDHKQFLGGNGTASAKQVTSGGTQSYNFKDICGKCGAKRIDSQIGLEESPDAYVETMRQVFSEVWRVLRDDGTVWLNLGDSYSGSGKGGNPENGKQSTNKGSQSIGVLYGKTGESARQAAVTNVSRRVCANIGLKPKDLIGIPWRVALALQADGWWLRSDIIWHKPNPMPESVTDRPTRSHEYIFLLTKSARYFYDADAIKEPYSPTTMPRMERGVSDNHKHINGADGQTIHTMNKPRLNSKYTGQATKDYDFGGAQNPSDTKRRVEESILNGSGANKRTVWTVTTANFPESHFATFPPDLIKPCILAGCPVGGTVLDPFGGSGTVGEVALEYGRQAILIELNPAYIELIKNRTNVTPGLAL